MKLGRKWTKIRAKIVSDDNKDGLVKESFGRDTTLASTHGERNKTRDRGNWD